MAKIFIKNAVKTVIKFFFKDQIELFKSYLYYKYIAKIDIKKGYESRREQFEKLFSR